LQVDNADIQAIHWSPLGSHLLTWQRPIKDSDKGNLIVWNAKSGEEVSRFNQKIYSKEVCFNNLDEEEVTYGLFI
jgi:uncharacterized protein with WD repeat